VIDKNIFILIKLEYPPLRMHNSQPMYDLILPFHILFLCIQTFLEKVLIVGWIFAIVVVGAYAIVVVKEFILAMAFDGKFATHHIGRRRSNNRVNHRTRNGVRHAAKDQQ